MDRDTGYGHFGPRLLLYALGIRPPPQETAMFSLSICEICAELYGVLIFWSYVVCYFNHLEGMSFQAGMENGSFLLIYGKNYLHSKASINTQNGI
jgi:hypothetical protein